MGQIFFKLVILYGNIHMEHLDTRLFLLPVKVLKWPSVHKNDVVVNLCKKKIIFFIVAFQFIVPYYIPDDVIKHQTTWHDTSRITITDILTFHWINNRATCQGNSFYGGNNSLPNGGNVFILFFIIEWRKHTNLEKRSFIYVKCD